LRSHGFLAEIEKVAQELFSESVGIVKQIKGTLKEG